MPNYALLLGDRSAKPKGSIRLLVMYVDTAFWLCTAANKKLNKGWYDERIMDNYTGCYIYKKVNSPIYIGLGYDLCVLVVRGCISAVCFIGQ